MFRSGFIGIFGFPNSGKSTLTNALIGEKVSILSAKPQTTRRRVSGVLTREDFQLVFVDTPGFVQGPTNELNEFLEDEVQRALENVDVAVFLLSVEELGRPDRLMKFKRECRKPSVLVITKADMMTEPAAQMLATLGEAYLTISAARHPADAAQQIVEAVKGLVPETGAPLLDTEIFTTQTSRELAAEVVREKCFLNLDREVPYQLAVNVRSFKEEDKLNRIECDILVGREGHKGIVIGQNARKLKKIGTEARSELEKIFGTKVYLGLHVSHKPNWMKSHPIMKELGYVSDGRE
jgi:GTP-binding protein Era